MNKELIPFDFKGNEIRIVSRDGEVWFVAGDVAQVLGYAEAKDMTRWLDEDEKGVHNVPTLSKSADGRGGGEQQLLIISESGLYHALLKSRREEAKPFRVWVTKEVLPSIRKTGTYSAKPKPAPKPKDFPYQTPQIEAVLHPKIIRQESVLGAFFSMPEDNLHFCGVDMGLLLQQFRAATQLAREIAQLRAAPPSEETILISAIHATAQVTGADLSLLFRGKPLHVDSVSEQFMSPTQLGTMFNFYPPASQINAHLVNMGLQEPGNRSVLYHPTSTGLPYAEFRTFVQPGGSTRTHLFWRPSIIPLLQSYFSRLEPAFEDE
ncbi:hypothetical protein JKG47_01815 [Acidithiobacillus sp. MC6.1]|nr:hypothetical protein [Acidithiobacillus sp. MC6.1]